MKGKNSMKKVGNHCTKGLEMLTDLHSRKSWQKWDFHYIWSQWFNLCRDIWMFLS